jgi:predicted DNA-binding ribbon-helix-helix protein
LRRSGSSAIVKRSVTIAGHRWAALRRIARQRGSSVSQLVAEIDGATAAADGRNLSSAVRVFVLQAAQAGEDRT